MRFGSALAMVTSVWLFQAASPAHALCAGFIDVNTGLFCNNVTWMKNRQVTLGCGNGTTYCPNEGVIRLQMAAFMNRVGNTLTPVVLSLEEEGPSLNIATGGPFHVCQSGMVPAVPYTRTAVAQFSMSYALATAQGVDFGLATAVGGGAFPGAPTTLSFAGPGQHQHHFVSSVGTLLSGQSYRFAIVVSPSSFREVAS